MTLLQEIEAEVPATRKCLERVPHCLFDWKPHEISMTMGYLTQLVGEIPNWITAMIEDAEIDLATYEHMQPADTEDLVKHFDLYMERLRQALSKVKDEEFERPFQLKSNGQVLRETSKQVSIVETINHLVHHRGQLTVYMRLNDIPVPSIYGPSADDRSF